MEFYLNNNNTNKIDLGLIGNKKFGRIWINDYNLLGYDMHGALRNRWHVGSVSLNINELVTTKIKLFIFLCNFPLD